MALPNCEIKIDYVEFFDHMKLARVTIARHRLPECSFYAKDINKMEKLYWILGIILPRLRLYLSFQIYCHSRPFRERHSRYLTILRPVISHLEKLIQDWGTSGTDLRYNYSDNLRIGVHITPLLSNTTPDSEVLDRIQLVLYHLKQLHSQTSRAAFEERAMVQRYSDLRKFIILISEDTLIAIQFLKHMNKDIENRFDTMYSELQSENLAILKERLPLESNRVGVKTIPYWHTSLSIKEPETFHF